MTGVNEEQLLQSAIFIKKKPKNKKNSELSLGGGKRERMFEQPGTVFVFCLYKHGIQDGRGTVWGGC